MFESPDHEETPSLSLRRMPVRHTSITKSADADNRSNNKAVDRPAVSPTPARKDSFIGSYVVFRGELSAEEEIIIHGTVEGTVAPHAKLVLVGKEGRVRALIHAQSVRIEGRVDGDIHGDDFVELIKGATVTGNIFSPCVSIDKGVDFNGTVTTELPESQEENI